MATQQIDPILAAQGWRWRVHLKRHAVFIKTDLLRAPVVFLTRPDADNFRLCARGDFLRPLIAAIDEKFSVRRQQFCQPAFFPRHPRDVAKKFQMLAADVRQHTELRPDHAHERREFARMIRAGFQHGGLMRLFQPQQRCRHADVIVETGLAPERRQLLPQHGGKQFQQSWS